MTVLYQFNTLASLMSGFYDGQLSMADISRRGDFGIGCFDQVDGEMIILDGVIYQAQADKEARAADAEQTSPYVAVTTQQADVKFDISGRHDLAGVERLMEEQLLSRNLFHSVKLHGNFSRLKVRMAVKTPSGVGFDVVSAHQAEYERSDISGTVVGFWTPSLFQSVSLAGFHLHFISDDKTFGGHVYDFSVDNAEIELGKIDSLTQDFAIHDESLLKQEIDLLKTAQIIEATE